MDAYLQSCCGDQPRIALPESVDARALLGLLASGLVWAALVSWLAGPGRRRRPRPRPDVCGSLDCTRCHGWAEAASRAARRLADLAAAGEGAASDRVRTAVERWARGKDSGLVIDGISDRAWWDGAHSNDVKRLKAAWPDIVAEYRWASGQRDQWSVNSTGAGCWRVFWLVNQGVPRDDVCPVTQATVASLGDAMHNTVFSNVCFSVLEPGTQIEPHTGPTNARVRCHLGLEVPADCRLVVDGQARQWPLGDCLVFDDSYLHRAEHGGSTGQPPRAVLMVDMWHPALAHGERHLLARALRPPQLDR